MLPSVMPGIGWGWVATGLGDESAVVAAVLSGEGAAAAFFTSASRFFVASVTAASDGVGIVGLAAAAVGAGAGVVAAGAVGAGAAEDGDDWRPCDADGARVVAGLVATGAGVTAAGAAGAAVGALPPPAGAKIKTSPPTTANDSNTQKTRMGNTTKVGGEGLKNPW